MELRIAELVNSELLEAKNTFAQLFDQNGTLVTQLSEMSKAAAHALKQGGTLFFAGNGGSFADAQHMAAEFTGKLNRDRAPLSAVVLGANSSSISAIGNDYSFEEVFAREFIALKSGADVVIAFTTSGKSKNIIALAKAAQSAKTPFYAFTGLGESPLDELGSVVHAPSLRTERVQEVHTMLGHLFCLLVEEQMDIF